MKTLNLHCDYINFKALKKALKSVDEIAPNQKLEGEAKDCLVVLTAVEKSDTKESAGKLVENIKDIAKKVGTSNIVLYPYAHLSSNLGKPETAVSILNEAAKKLKGFNVTQAPFGYYKQFEMKVKGHPLSELSREIISGTEGSPMDAKMETSCHLVYETARKMLGEEFISISETGDGKATLNWKNIKKDIDDKFLSKLEKEVNKNLEADLSITIESLERKKALKKCGGFYDDVVPKKFDEVRVVSIGNLPPEPCIKPHVSSTKEIGSKIKINGFEKVGEGSYKIKISIDKGNEEEPELTEKERLQMWKKMSKVKMQAPRGNNDMKSNVELGRDLDLYIVNDVVGKGLPLLTPKGAAIKREIERFIVDEELKRGYEHTSTPIIAKSDLYKISGHWQHYKDDMFTLDVGGKDYALRPMTCPFQFVLYKRKPRTYKDLPKKYAEIATLFRKEQSGELRGLTRMWQFTLADAHILCTPDQLEEEFKGVMDLIKYVMDTFGIEVWYRFSKWDSKEAGKKYIDNPKAWEATEASMKKILDKLGIKYKEAIGEATFYGPKLDLQYKDVYGKEDTLITLQIDFAASEKFNLTYKDKDGKEKHTMIIHRSSTGATERVISYLLEKTQGNLPLWLSPVQARVMSMNENVEDHAEEIKQRLISEGIRTEIDNTRESIGKKARNAIVDKVFYLVTVGEKEKADGKIAVRARDSKEITIMTVDEFIEKAKKEIAERK